MRVVGYTGVSLVESRGWSVSLVVGSPFRSPAPGTLVFRSEVGPLTTEDMKVDGAGLGTTEDVTGQEEVDGTGLGTTRRTSPRQNPCRI